ncbi:4558_t:CDS:2, partial [Paraglomus occultum]
VWKVARNDTRFELGIWGSSSDNSIVDLVKQCAKPILFSASFIKSLCEECSNAEDLIKDLDKFVSKDTKNRFSDHWCNTRLGKEDEKRIAFRRGALKKAANGLQKVYERLTSIGSSPSSRKRKNLQAFFVLLPILLTQLCDALSALMSTNDQKIMLESLIFVERWCSLCIKGSWEKFVETYNKFSEEISQIMRKKKVADELACDS